MHRQGLYSDSKSKVYGRVTNDPGLLRRAMNDINGAFPYTYCSSSPPTQLIIGTWIDYMKTGSRTVSIMYCTCMCRKYLLHYNKLWNSYLCP